MTYSKSTDPFKGAASKNCIVCGEIFYNARFDKHGHRIGKYTLKKWEEARFCSFSCRNKVVKNRLGYKSARVTYHGLHKWVYRTLGKHPEKCAHCGLIGESKSKRWTIEYANKSGTYQRDVSDWLTLCVPCHRKHDKFLRNV
jgi:hypothetical protein